MLEILWDLQNILGVDDSFNAVDAAFVYRHARKGLGFQKFDELFHCCIHRHCHHLGARLHGLAYRFAAELYN